MKALSKIEVTIEILRSKCEDVESSSEADILVSLLENITKDYDYDIHCLTAPETNVLKKVAIIRTPNFSIDLINPKIMGLQDRVVSLRESCASFPGAHYNCFRYDTVFIENGFKKEVLQLKGYPALLAQHAIDHLNGTIYHDRLIKFAVVRNGGRILGKDYCPCGSNGSKKRFDSCCAKK